MDAKILAFDTATDALTVAILKVENDQQTIENYFQLAPQRHSELILPIISNLLAQTSLSLKNLDAIAFGCGPGSFMGVRIATGIAQGLAFGANLPVIAISTLRTLAQVTYDTYQTPKVIAGWDARMQEIYWGKYQVNSEGLMELVDEEQLSPPHALLIPPDNEWCAAGNAWRVYQDQLPPSFSQQIAQKRTDLYPEAKALAKLALDKLKRGEILTPTQAQPVYLRDKVVR